MSVPYCRFVCIIWEFSEINAMLNPLSIVRVSGYQKLVIPMPGNLWLLFFEVYLIVKQNSLLGLFS